MLIHFLKNIIAAAKFRRNERANVRPGPEAHDY
jgi:hypothetical protein